MNPAFIKAPWYHNQMPQYQKDNCVFFVATVDTSAGRAASYIGVVYDDVNNSRIVGYIAYGKITATHTKKDVSSIHYRDTKERDESIAQMNTMVRSHVNAKLSKNYVQQDYFVDSSVTPAQSKPSNVPPPNRSIDEHHYISTMARDFPDRVEHAFDAHDKILEAPHYIWERYPNRMRMMYVVLFKDCIALYNVSGGLTGDIKYDDHKHVIGLEMLEDIGEGLLFTGHRDPVGNIVIHQYLRKLNDTGVSMKKLTWAQQKSITTYLFNTLYNKKEDIYDSNLPIYLNDYVTGRQDALIMIAMYDPGYATNVMFHDPHKEIVQLHYLER